MDGREDIGKVAFISPGPPGTSGAVVATELCAALSEHCEIEHLFVNRKNICEESRWEGYPVRNIPFTLGQLRWWQANRKIGRYGLYHYNDKRYLPLVRYGRKPAVLTVHGLAPLRDTETYPESSRRRYRKYFRYLDEVSAVIANSKHTAGDLVETLGVPAEKIEVVYFGVNPDAYKPRDRKKAREELGIPGEAIVILNVGSERKDKNIETMLDVFQRLSKEFDNLHLARIGDREERYTRLMKDAGLAGRIIRPGRSARPSLYYNAADVYLCLDLHASFGMPNLEACLLYTSPSPRDLSTSRMPSSA